LKPTRYLAERRGRSDYALFYMDFNKFNVYYRACGYHTATKVLIAFSRVLLSSLHPANWLRYTSDMFSPSCAMKQGKKLRARLQDLQCAIWRKFSARHHTGPFVSLAGGAALGNRGPKRFFTIVDRAKYCPQIHQRPPANSFAVI
jgi:GGDEF domain-containing protein